MARLYANENFTFEVVELLRSFGHNVLTVQETGKAELSWPDDEVLAFAISQDRAVLTFNRRDFFKLHDQNPVHAGIIACTTDDNSEELASRIHQAITDCDEIKGTVIRIYRPQA